MSSQKILTVQVCNVEQSEKLKELGVEQHSIFWWQNNIKKPELKLDLRGQFTHVCVSAFTVSELGEMIPTGYHTKRGLNNKEELKWFAFNPNGDYLMLDGEDTEAECRAALLIDLMEEGKA